MNTLLPIAAVIVFSTVTLSCKMRTRPLEKSSAESVPGTGEDPLMDRIFARYNTDVKGIDVADLQPEQLGDCEFRSYAAGDRTVKPIKVTATSSKGLGESTTILRTEFPASSDSEDFNVAIASDGLSGGIGTSTKTHSDDEMIAIFRGSPKSKDVFDFNLWASYFKRNALHEFKPILMESKFICVGKVTSKNGVTQITIEIGKRLSTKYSRGLAPETRFDASEVPQGVLMRNGSSPVFSVDDWNFALQHSLGKVVKSKCQEFSSEFQIVTGLAICAAK